MGITYLRVSHDHIACLPFTWRHLCCMIALIDSICPPLIHFAQLLDANTAPLPSLPRSSWTWTNVGFEQKIGISNSCIDQNNQRWRLFGFDTFMQPGHRGSAQPWDEECASSSGLPKHGAKQRTYVTVCQYHKFKNLYNFYYKRLRQTVFSKIFVRKVLQGFCLKASSPRASSFKTVVSSKDADCGPPLALCDSLIFAA